MKEKIKNLLTFIVNGWRASLRGKIGVICIIFACVMFIRLFFGEVSIQHFIIHVWKLNTEQSRLITEQQKLEQTKHKIKLLHEHSPDYVEELSQKHMNMGAPELRILK